MAFKGSWRFEDGSKVEGPATSVKYLSDDGEEVEGHNFRGSWRSEDEDKDDVEGHGPMFRLSTDDPTVVAALGKAAGIEGPGEADLNIPITITNEDGSEVEGHSVRGSWRENADGDLEADVEGHSIRGGW